MEKASKKVSDNLKAIAPTQYSAWYYPLVAFSAALFLIGCLFGLHGFLKGHHEVFNVTRIVPLGILLSTYIFFVVSSTGCCLVIPFLVHIFGYEKFKPFMKRMVFMALATIFSGFIVLLFELEQPWNMVWNYITPNLRSNIWWMSTFYCMYIFFMALEFLSLMVRKTKYGIVLGALGATFGLAAHSNLGGVFATLTSRPWWHSSVVPIYFITSAFVCGAALTILFTFIAYKLRKKEITGKINEGMFAAGKFLFWSLVALMFFYAWEVIVGIFCTPHEKYEVTMALLAGPLRYNFWIFEIGLGIMVPLFTTLFMVYVSKRRSVVPLFVAALSCMTGVFIMRYDFVVATQLVPSWHSIGAVGYEHYATYFPSLHELAIVAGGFGFCMLFYLAVERFLGLDWFSDEELAEISKVEDEVIASAEEIVAERKAKIQGPWQLEAVVKADEPRRFKLDKARRILEEAEGN